MTKKNQIKFPEKKNFQFLQLPKTTQKIPQQQQQKKFCHTPQFFFTSNEQDTKKKEKKITKRKKQKTSKRKRNNVFVFYPEVPKKRLQLAANPRKHKKQARKTKILQKNPMKYTHKKVELKKEKKSSETKNYQFSFLLYYKLVKLT
jgi:hypothetical protein